MWRPTTLAFAVSLAALAVSGCGAAAISPAATPSGTGSATEGALEATQRDEAGEVTVDVTWSGPAAGAVFDVTLDTHSVDLDALDLSDAVLTNDRGETLVAVPWDAPPGGHHRAGRLAFDGDALAFLADTTWIELTINAVGGVPERVLRWEVPG